VNECKRPASGDAASPLGPAQSLHDEIANATKSAQEFRMYWPMLGALLPMFLWVDLQGNIRAMGPTLHKVLGGDAILDQPFSQHFRVGRRQDRSAPDCEAGDAAGSCENSAERRGDCDVSKLTIANERMVHLTLLSQPAIGLRGEAFILGPSGENGTLMNLSFGFYLREAVATFALTERDFSPADLAMELLYLQEAKSLVMQELRALTLRLDTARKQAETQALTDPLTRLANRRAMEAALEQASAGASQGGAPFTLIQIDLDYFKSVNDTLGHAAGDYVLLAVARILREEMRAGDLAGRMGGDEFLLLLRGVMAPGKVLQLTERIISRLQEPKWHEGRECLISGSLGVVMSLDYHPPETERMLVDVDTATYAAKAAGRGCCILYRDLETVKS
jgi:diguanylate cyclase (GGDEF)-like protein